MIRQRTDPRAVVSIVSGGHFVSHFYLLTFPPLFPLLADEFGLSNAELGAIVSAVMFPILLLQIPGGELVDRIGAKPVFVGGVAVTAAGVLAAGVVDSYLLLLAAALGSGIGQAAFHPADYALLEAVVDDEHEGKAFSVHAFGGYAGFAVAPVVVGGIGLSLGWRPAVLLAGLAGGGYALLSQLVMAPIRRDRGPTILDDGGASPEAVEHRQVLLSPPLVVVAVFFMLLFAAITGIQSFTVVFVDRGLGLGPGVGNTALTAFAAMSALGVLAGGPVADRYDARRVAAVGYLLGAAVIGLLVVGPGPASAAVAVGLLGLLGIVYGLPVPSRDRLVTLYAPGEATGRSFGFVFSGGSLGGFAAPLVLGGVIDLWSPAAAFAVIGGFLVGCVMVVSGLAVADRRRTRS